MEKIKLSFEGCPNNCIDGFYVNPYTHRRMECEYCAEKRKELAKGNVVEDKDISEILNLPKSFTGQSFDSESVIPSFAARSFEKDSVTVVIDRMQKLYYDASVGVVPTNSILFNLGPRVFESNFIYPYLIAAYKSGLSCAPYLTDYDVRMLFSREETTFGELDINSVLKADICCVVILTSADEDSIYATKGLMEFRAHYDKSTILFIKVWGNMGLKVRELISEDGILSKSLAEFVSIKYTSGATIELDRQMAISKL